MILKFFYLNSYLQNQIFPFLGKKVFGFIILIFEFFQYFKKKGTKKEQKRIKTSLERKINRQKTFNYYRFKYWWRRLHRIIMSQKKYFIVGILVLCFIFAIIIYLGYSNTKGTPGIYLDSDLPPLKLPKLPKL